MNSRYRKVLSMTVGVALCGLIASVAWANGSGYRGGEHPMMGMARHGMSGHGGATSHLLRYLLRHQKDLGLTDEQVTKLKSLALDQDRAKIRAHADVQVAERELRALVWDDKTDLSVIETKVKERAVFEATLRFIGIKAKRDLFAVLTPEQREKQKAIFDQMRRSHRARMSSNRGTEEADHEKTAEGITSTPEIGSHDSDGSLPTS